MKRSIVVLILAGAAFFRLIPGAEIESFGKDRGFGRDDSFGRADTDRDGFVGWKEYRDFRRDGSRGDFSRRDWDRDSRLNRDEWESLADRSDRWPSRR